MSRRGMPLAGVKQVFLNRKLLTGLLTSSLIVVVALFGLIQLVPYGRDHSNPPVVNEPSWNISPQTREYAVRACYDCHSNEAIGPGTPTWPLPRGWSKGVWTGPRTS